MKKAFTILFLILYFVLNVGLNIMIHTCGGESVVLLAATSADDPCVCDDGVPMDDMCCTTELKTVKLDDSQKTTAEPTAEKLAALDLLFIETEPALLFHDSGSRIHALIPFSPPPNRDFQISNSVFLI
ncbi:MAG: hypothetical protein AB1728_09860 [Bacteroidota bacterium]